MIIHGMAQPRLLTQGMGQFEISVVIEDTSLLRRRRRGGSSRKFSDDDPRNPNFFMNVGIISELRVLRSLGVINDQPIASTLNKWMVSKPSKIFLNLSLRSTDIKEDVERLIRVSGEIIGKERK